MVRVNLRIRLRVKLMVCNEIVLTHITMQYIYFSSGSWIDSKSVSVSGRDGPMGTRLQFW